MIELEHVCTDNLTEFCAKLKFGHKKVTYIPTEVFDETDNVIAVKKSVLNTWYNDFYGLYSRKSGNSSPQEEEFNILMCHSGTLYEEGIL